eukprot:1161604-Pelagomonas_calceolata.AAC.6
MVSQIEIGRLQDGFDEDFDYLFRGDGSHASDDGDDDDGTPGGVLPWLEDAQGSENVEDASIFAPKPGSEANIQVGHEASLMDDN